MPVTKCVETPWLCEANRPVFGYEFFCELFGGDGTATRGSVGLDLMASSSSNRRRCTARSFSVRSLFWYSNLAFSSSNRRMSSR